MKTLPSAESFVAAAWFLRCEVPAIRAVAEVESGPHGAFLATGEPVILYERHLFHRLTGGIHGGVQVKDAAREYGHLSLSAPGGYGPVSLQHVKLEAAVVLDREAALKSCSWGLFQILGLNHVRAGYPNLQRFINAMYREVDDHLRAFVMFIRGDDQLLDALRSLSWDVFAQLYNGPAYRRNDYHNKLAKAYERLSGER